MVEADVYCCDGRLRIEATRQVHCLVKGDSLVPAVSAASSPASRIARRAFGLALIAAAAAARPAASISLLIAALASLSTVSLPVPDEEPEELFRGDLAMNYLPPVSGKDTSRL